MISTAAKPLMTPPPSSPDDASKAEAKEEAIPISFSGTGAQYFKIFVSNTLLTIVTLGIYSAWARVRTRRFFMGHTCIGKHNLEFDASPLSILFSRIIIAAVLGLLFFIEINYELVWAGVGVFLLGTLALTPLAIVRGRAFIARHTVHRTVRFHYRREYLWAAQLFGAYAVLIILLTIGGFTENEEDFPYEAAAWSAIAAFLLCAPALFYYSHRIQISQLQFGKLRLHFDSSVGLYYLTSLKALLLAALLSVGAFLVLNGAKEYFTNIDLWPFFLIFILFPLIALYAAALLQSAFTCTYWKSIRIGDDSSVDASKLSLTGYSNLLAQNYFMILISLGLLYPIARVRAYRHIAERVEIKLGPTTATAYHASSDKTSPLAGEFADLTDWDIDFGAF